jgi:hypothetical protein
MLANFSFQLASAHRLRILFGLSAAVLRQPHPKGAASLSSDCEEGLCRINAEIPPSLCIMLINVSCTSSKGLSEYSDQFHSDKVS